MRESLTQYRKCLCALLVDAQAYPRYGEFQDWAFGDCARWACWGAALVGLASYPNLLDNLVGRVSREEYERRKPTAVSPIEHFSWFPCSRVGTHSVNSQHARLLCNADKVTKRGC